jgi:Tfp pilus assembly protein PilF
MTPWIRMAILGLAAGALTACATPEGDLAQRESAQTHYTIGIGALADGNLKKAISDLQIAVQEDPRNPATPAITMRSATRICATSSSTRPSRPSGKPLT